MDDITRILGGLRQAADLPELLAGSWQAFELARELADTAAGLSADLYPAFAFARGAAVSGRNELAAAPSLPLQAAGSPARVASCEDAGQAADMLALLASALTASLRTAAGQARDTADRLACENAAGHAARMHSLLAASPQSDGASAARPR